MQTIQQFKETLSKLGLTDKEAAVYLALLEEGSSTAEQVARITKLNRSTTYVQIKQLMSIGLVSTFKKGKKTFFAAESPNNLEIILEHRRRELDEKIHDAGMLVPELMKLYMSKGDRPVGRMFEGKDGLATMRKEILSQKPKEVFIMTNYDTMKKIFNHDELVKFTRTRDRLGITSWVIYTMSRGEDFTGTKHQKLKRVSGSAAKNIGADIYIYNDTVSFATAKDEIVGMTVVNADFAQSMRLLFKTMWGTL